jgi:hypothetical protein
VKLGQLDGRCLCGSVTYQCDGDVVAALLCHCTDCQRQSGSPIVSLPDATPELVWIRAGTLNDPSSLTPQVEIWARSTHPHVQPDGENRSVFARTMPV